MVSPRHDHRQVEIPDRDAAGSGVDPVEPRPTIVEAELPIDLDAGGIESRRVGILREGKSGQEYGQKESHSL
jgi:hypothetical protein